MNNRFITLKSAPDAVRRESFLGNEHLVVPVVALVEGVLQGATSETPEFVAASEFSKVVPSWNARPVTMGHPQRNGAYVSAGSPDVMETETVGFIFNTFQDETKLKMEMWVDTQVAPDSLLSRFESGEEIEVSTGYFCDVTPTEGFHNNAQYFGVQSNIIPDHLAILEPGEKGACSWEDGCGAPRMNFRTHKEFCCEGCKDGTGCEEKVKSNADAHNQALGEKEVLAKYNQVSDEDLRTSIISALDEQWAYVVAVFDDYFVYYADDTMYRRDYSLTDDKGTVTLGEDMVEVRPTTEYIDIERKTDMSMNERVTALIANELTNFSDADSEWLESLDEGQLEKLEPVVVNVEHNAPATADEYIAAAPDDMRDMLQSGLKMHAEKKASLVTSLSANEKCDFSDDELNNMTMTMLERLSKIAVTDDYSARGGPTVNVDGKDDAIPAPLPVFNIKKTGSEG